MAGLVVVALVASVVSAACGGGHRRAAAPPPSIPPSTTAPVPTFPLNGLPADNVTAGRSALSVKVDNVAPALPQSGLNRADVVTEALVEGGQTRLFVTFHSQDADLVGPIRSARPVDADLLNQLGGGIFAYSGAAPGEIAPVEDHSNATLLSFDSGNPAFYRDPGRPAPHNVYSSTAALYQAGAEAGNHSPSPPPLFQYGAPNSGRPASRVDFTMGERLSAAWTWNAATGSYEREQNGHPDVVDDGSLVATTDIMIMAVAIQGTGIFDTIGEEDPLVVITGTGPCWLLRDGQVSEGHWTRPSTNDHTTFTDANGAPLQLRPGRTWLELLPNTSQPLFR